ncbi:MAG: hypothetical protein ACE5LB_14135 [Acidiferrobacterales bacterium]
MGSDRFVETEIDGLLYPLRKAVITATRYGWLSQERAAYGLGVV